jgi:hypothetical protein
MAVKILIKRSIGQQVASVLQPLIVELRAHAMKQPGYISGETLKCLERPGEYLWSAPGTLLLLGKTGSGAGTGISSKAK